jgi:hypothetical protein
MFRRGGPLLLRERLEQWRAYNRWEQESPDSPVAVDVLVNWYSQAWDLSRRHSPAWQDAEVDMAKVAHLRRIRQNFALLGSDILAP